jgi:pyruvate kinase
LRFDPDPRRAKIVCTLGPASESPDTVAALIAAGMDVARLNFSHGQHQGHRRLAETVREAARRLGRHVAVLQDLQGHKVRVGRLEGPAPIRLEPGQQILVGHGAAISPSRLGIDYRNAHQHVLPDHHVYLDDGSIELEVLTVEGSDLRCEVRVGGELRGRKGVIFPESELPFPLLNEQDLSDARFGIEIGADMVAMSFVRSAAEVEELRRRLLAWGNPRPYLVAKIEDAKGIENLDAILAAADGVLIARGDLGVSLPRERVPGLQKWITRSANAAGVPVITATQMLESMTSQHKPTRAEVNDVHNAVLDGSDAVMLSAETATGSFPVRAVEEMDRIVRAAEREFRRSADAVTSRRVGFRVDVAEAAAALSGSLDARCVLAFSLSGKTLQALSAARCPVPVYGVVEDEVVLRQLLLHRGLSLNTLPHTETLEDLIQPCLTGLQAAGIAASGDHVLTVASRAEPGSSASYVLRLDVLE